MLYILQGYNCLHLAICEGHVGIVSDLLASSACELTRMAVSDLGVGQCIYLKHACMDACMQPICTFFSPQLAKPLWS